MEGETRERGSRKEGVAAADHIGEKHRYDPFSYWKRKGKTLRKGGELREKGIEKKNRTTILPFLTYSEKKRKVPSKGRGEGNPIMNGNERGPLAPAAAFERHGNWRKPARKKSQLRLACRKFEGTIDQPAGKIMDRKVWETAGSLPSAIGAEG